MSTEARIFFAWTPLHLLIATAAAATSCGKNSLILVWIGPKNSQWTTLISYQSLWTHVFDLSDWTSLSFWNYVRDYKRILHDVTGVLKQILGDYRITEISVATDDEFASLMFIKAYGRMSGENPWTIVSIFEDGTGLYFWTHHRRILRHLIKLIIDTLLLKRSIPWTLGYESGNPNITKIYAVCPQLVPRKTGKEIVDISDRFQAVCLLFSKAAHTLSPLPQRSGVILSERSRLTSPKVETSLIKQMVNYLKSEHGITNIYVKYHHFDPPSKKALYLSIGITNEIASPGLPYEILHHRLNPDCVVSVSSAALFYCSLRDNCSKFIAFCGHMKGMGPIAKLYSERNIIVMSPFRK